MTSPGDNPAWNLIAQRLKAARGTAHAALKSADLHAYWAAQEQVLRLERETAAAKGEEYAEPFGFPVEWDVGAPMPHLLVNDHGALLAFHVRNVDPNWDGTTVAVAGTSGPEPIALVEFEWCTAAKLGDPNDEVFHGHPLHGRGLEGYTAQVVRNSRWIAELERINSVHACYRPERWRDLNHYVFWFHDSTFECVARSYKVETRVGTMDDVLAEMCRRVLR